MVRLGTKTPMVLPQRITPALVRMLRHFRPLYVSIHCTHPSELTPEAALACNRLADAGIPLGAQTVLLRGGERRRRHPDGPVPGAPSHARASVLPVPLRSGGRDLAFPHLAGKGPGDHAPHQGPYLGLRRAALRCGPARGRRKTPVCPDYLARREGDKLIFTNYEGRECSIHDPVEDTGSATAHEETKECVSA